VAYVTVQTRKLKGKDERDLIIEGALGVIFGREDVDFDIFAGADFNEDEDEELYPPKTVTREDNVEITQISTKIRFTGKEHDTRMKILDQYFDSNTAAEKDSSCALDFRPEESTDIEFDYEMPPGVVSVTPDTGVYDRQQQIEAIFKNPLQKMKDGKEPSTMLDLYNLGIELNLSEAEGDLLLQFMSKYSSAQGACYKRWKGLRSGFKSQWSEIVTMRELLIPLDKEWFGEKNMSGGKLKQTTCFYFNILDRLGEACLEIEPEDFIKRFSPEFVTESQERIFTTFPTGKLFQRFCIWVRSTHGGEAVPLLVSLYFDGAQATKTRSATPLLMFINNVVRKSFRPIFLGYCPEDLPYSDSELICLLKQQAVGDRKPSKKSMEFAIRLAKRRAMFTFLDEVLQPLMKSSQHGLVIQIGGLTTKTSETVFVVCYLCNYIGDSAALHDIGSVKMRGLKCNCRRCMCSNTSVFGPENRRFTRRDSNLMYALAHELGQYELQEFKMSCGKKVRALTPAERTRKAAVKDLGKTMCCIPGTNTLIPHFSKLEDAGVFYFYLALCYDYLHTVWKGLCEYVVSWVLQIIHCIAIHHSKLGLQNPRFGNSEAWLDNRISHHTWLKESLQPVPFVTLSKGVSNLIKSDSKSTKGLSKTTGIMTGGFPAWQMRNLILHLIFGIGSEGVIVPNQRITLRAPAVSEKSKTKSRNSTLQKLYDQLSRKEIQKLPKEVIAAIFPEKGEKAGEKSECSVEVKRAKTGDDVVWDGNPTEVLLQALAAIFEITLFGEANQLTQSQLSEFQKFIDNGACLLAGLYNFRQKVFRIAGMLKADKLSIAVEVPRNIKTHACSHFPEMIEEFGAVSNTFNSSIGEKEHQKVVSKAYSRSSGVLSTTYKEMANYVLMSEFSKSQANAYRARMEKDKRGQDMDEDPCGSDLDSDEEIDETLLSVDQLSDRATIKFHAIAELGSIELCSCDSDAMLEAHSEKLSKSKGSGKKWNIRFLHNLLETSELYSLIAQHALLGLHESASVEERHLNQFWKRWIEGDSSHHITLFGGVRGDALPDQGMNTFYLRADHEYRGNSRGQCFQVFNSFEAHYPPETYSIGEEQTTFAKIFALVGFTTDDSFHIWVALARFKRISASGRNPFPFPEYGFEAGRGNQLSIDFIPIESVKRPCFMAISSDSKNDMRYENERNASKMRWHCIPFSRAVKTSNVAYDTCTRDGSNVFRTENEMSQSARLFGLEGNHEFVPGARLVESIRLKSMKTGGGGGPSDEEVVGPEERDLYCTSGSEDDEEPIRHWDSDSGSDSESEL